MKYKDFDCYEIFPYDDKVINIKRNKELKQSTNDRGYKYYRLYKDKKAFCIRTNRLYYECIYGEIPEGMEIDHINGDRSDNRIENLRAVNHTDNMRNPLTLEKIREHINNEERRRHHSEIMKGRFSGEKNPMYGKPRPKGASVPPKQIKVYKNEELIAVYQSINEAARDLNLSRGNINSCLNGSRKQTKGYTFELV